MQWNKWQSMHLLFKLTTFSKAMGKHLLPVFTDIFNMPWVTSINRSCK